MSYTHLWLDIVAGLNKEAWKDKGGNFSSFRILEKEGKIIKVFLRDYKKLNEFDNNYVVVRYS